MAIGHTRYATTGASAWCNAQPIARLAGDMFFALGHNGNLVNTAELAAGRLDADLGSDSDVVAALLAERATRRCRGDLSRALTAGAAPAPGRLLLRDHG